MHATKADIPSLIARIISSSKLGLLMGRIHFSKSFSSKGRHWITHNILPIGPHKFMLVSTLLRPPHSAILENEPFRHHLDVLIVPEAFRHSGLYNVYHFISLHIRRKVGIIDEKYTWIDYENWVRSSSKGQHGIIHSKLRKLYWFDTGCWVVLEMHKRKELGWICHPASVVRWISHQGRHLHLPWQ